MQQTTLRHFVTLHRIRLTRDGYTYGRQGGVYFGAPEIPLYYHCTECPVTGQEMEGFIRAADRESAKFKVQRIHPNGWFRP